MGDFTVRAVTEEDRTWLSDFFMEHWGSPQMVYSQGIHPCDQLPGFVAVSGAEVVGLLTYSLAGGQCEIVSLDSLREGCGIGSALLQATEDFASTRNIGRLWLITTNDNLHALGFYQKRGYELVQIYRLAVEAARRIKPQIPLHSADGIPIRDEIELEKRLVSLEADVRKESV